jgi:hypothetical protein
MSATVIVLIVLAIVLLFVVFGRKKSAVEPAASSISVTPPVRSVAASSPGKKPAPEDSGLLRSGRPARALDRMPHPPRSIADDEPLSPSTERSLLFGLSDGARPTLVPVPFPSLRCICDDIVITPSGDGIYLSVFREKREFANLFTFQYFRFGSGRVETLADVETDSSYYQCFIGDHCFRTRAVKKYETHAVLCFKDGVEVPVPDGDVVVESMLRFRDRLVMKADGPLYLVGADGTVDCLRPEPEVTSVEWLHPERKLLLFTCRAVDPETGKPHYDNLGSYFVAELDENLAIKTKRRVALERPDRKYSRFSLGRDDELIFVESVDLNGDGVADYNESRNMKILAMDLRTGTIRTVLDEMLDLCCCAVHPEGFILCADETVEDHEVELFVIDLNTGKKHPLITLRGGCFRDFRLNRDWTRVAYRKVLDTTGRGTFYSWEDESEIWAIDLLRQGASFQRAGMVKLESIENVPVEVPDRAKVPEAPARPVAGPSATPAGTAGGASQPSTLAPILEALVGGHPSELEASFLLGRDVPALIAKITRYQTMAHPQSTMESMMGMPKTSPSYSITPQGIGRGGNPMNDAKLCSVAVCVRGRDCGYDERAVRLAFEIIQRYAKWNLAKYVFLMPHADKMVRSLQARQNAVVVSEELTVEVMKGVENMLFEIYEELGDGEVMGDEEVRKKLLSILR